MGKEGIGGMVDGKGGGSGRAWRRVEWYGVDERVGLVWFWCVLEEESERMESLMCGLEFRGDGLEIFERMEFRERGGH
jgi:hypothetical protein